MVYKLNDLKSFKLQCADGVLGTLDQCYYDDENWTVQYFVAHYGSWLSRKRVLFKPSQIDLVNSQAGAIHLKLSKQEIKKLPKADVHQTVARQRELEYQLYYGANSYWGEVPSAGAFGTAYPAGTPVRDSLPPVASPEDRHLHSTKETLGYGIEALDGAVGQLEDFVVDSDSWSILHLLGASSTLRMHQHYLVNPQFVREISWGERRIFLSVNRSEVRQISSLEETDALRQAS